VGGRRRARDATARAVLGDDHEHVSLAVAALQQVGEPARERIAKAVIAKASSYEQDGRVRIPGVARSIVGTK
jgi:hypothetical protein